MKITILFWNAAASRSNVALALENRAEYDVIAIQEPWINRNTGGLYCPRRCRYQSVFTVGRAALYIHKRHDIAAWEQRAGVDWSMITFGDGPDAVSVWSIYSPNQGDPTQWDSPLTELPATAPRGRHVLVGDFNTHHPMWDVHGRCSPYAGRLLEFTQRWRLSLATPYGEVTRQQQGQKDSTIDHAWVSGGLCVAYEGDQGLEGSDHRAQLVRVAGAAEARSEATVEGWNWQMFRRDIARAEADLRFRDQAPPLTTGAELDRRVDWIIAQLHEVADASTKRRTRSKGGGAEWWTPEVEDACNLTKRRRKAYNRRPNEHTQAQLQEAAKAQKETIAAAQAVRWRQWLAAASARDRDIWALERWARLRSSAPADSGRIPELTGSDGATTARTHAEKAALLAGRFFPPPRLPQTAALPSAKERFTVEQTVSSADVAQELRNTSQWKAPGDDLIPTGLLLHCGAALHQELAHIASASFALGYFPKRFRSARVVVIPKPGKTKEQKALPGAWRPISLTCTIGKLIEAILTRRIAAAAEEHRLLPDGQMGNRKDRSTELAVKVLHDVAHTAWRRGGIASLLQLDIKGAFDTVDHCRLLQVLTERGYPAWVVRWARSFLEARSARLYFDGATSEVLPVTAGVPQGSPLSPLLFLHYIGTLYEKLAAHPQLVIVGYADDTNLMAIGESPEATSRALEGAWATCARWAEEMGMCFEPSKSELLHLCRAHEAPAQQVRLGDAVISPCESARFLGVWIDRKLRWGEHAKRTKAKMKTQTLALTRLAASTWGCSLARARQIYTTVIRSALSYGAPIWHTTPKSNSRAAGPCGDFATTQAECLRIVCGAPKSTPIRYLEAEAEVPPLDIHLSYLTARFEDRLQLKGTVRLVRTACARTAAILKRARWARLRRHSLKASDPSDPYEVVEERTASAREWLDDHGDIKRARDARWDSRWEAGKQQRTRNAFAEDRTTTFKKRHKGLLRHESSILSQIRVDRLPLRAFLYKINAPGVLSPLCRCEEALETFEHVVLDCEAFHISRERMWQQVGRPPPRLRSELAAYLEEPRLTKAVARWLITQRLLPQYHKALEEAPAQEQALQEAITRETERRAEARRQRSAGDADATAHRQFL